MGVCEPHGYVNIMALSLFTSYKTKHRFLALIILCYEIVLILLSDLLENKLLPLWTRVSLKTNIEINNRTL